MRFLCLHHGDIFSEQLWSGIPLNIMKTLKAQGHEVVAVGNLRPGATLRGRIKGQLYKRLFRKLYLINRDPLTAAARARDANRRIRAAGKVDAIIATQLADAAFIEVEAPIITVHDATWIQLLDYYPGYERSGYAPETIAGGIALDKMGLERAAHCIFASEWAARSAHTDYGIPRSKLSVAPLGASLPRIPTREEHQSCLERRGTGACKFLFLGLEWQRKGGRTAVAILDELKRRGLPVELHVVGCTPEGEMPAFVRSHGRLWKNDPRQAEELVNLFENGDFFLLPTRAECFGLVFCEAAAYGLPVITADTGGVAEVVSADWAIAKPLPIPIAEYADWIMEHYRDREKYARASLAAREAFEQRLNWNVLCHHIAQVAGRLQGDPASHQASQQPRA